MAISVNVSGGGTIIASVNGADSADVAISGQSGPVAVGVSGGIGPAAVVSGTATSVFGVNQVTAGQYISISTASGLFEISANPPVLTVQGRTGNISLVAADLTAAAAAHTHTAAQVSNLTTVANVVSVNGQTGAVTLVAGSNVTVAASSGSVVISTGSSLPNQGGNSGPLVTDGTAASWVSRFSIVDPVLVQGDGVTLSRDSSAGAVTVSSKVLSVNGRTGNISLVASDLTAAAASHTHTAAQVSDFTTVANVVSVNGRTGVVSLIASDLTAAAASHAHTAAQVSDLTTVANVVSVNGRTGVVSLIASDVTAASASHVHPYVTSLNSQTGTLSIVAGSNVTVTTAVGTLTVSSGGGIGLNDAVDGGDYTGATP